MKTKYIYTNHLLERIQERFGIKVDWNNKKETYKKIDEIMSETNVDRSHLNNSKFMMNLHDLHGYDAKYEFRSHVGMDILFVMILENGGRIVKTCLPLSTTKFLKRVKFKKQNKQNRYSCRSKKKRQSLNEIEAFQEHLQISY